MKAKLGIFKSTLLNRKISNLDNLGVKEFSDEKIIVQDEH